MFENIGRDVKINFLLRALERALNENTPDMCHTLKVIQAKTKFNQVRVYVCLADEDKMRLKLALAAEPPHDTTNKTWYHHWHEECLITDAKHYRKCYMEIKKAFPEYWKPFIDGADYPHILCETEEEYKATLHLHGHGFSIDDVYEICEWKLEEDVNDNTD